MDVLCPLSVLENDSQASLELLNRQLSAGKIAVAMVGTEEGKVLVTDAVVQNSKDSSDKDGHM